MSQSTFLNGQQLADYQRQGYTMLGRVLDDATLAGLRDEEAVLRAGHTDPGNANRGTHFWSLVARHCPTLRQLATSGAHLDAVSSVVGPDVCLWWNQFVTKMPDASPKGEFPWHQDNGYVDLSVPTNVTVWIALDDVTPENGCVWVQPGSHAKGLLPHVRKSEDSWHLTVPTDGNGTAAAMPAGHAVMFSGFTLHRSLANCSQLPRRALFLEYVHPAADALRPGQPARTVTSHEETWVVRGKVPFPLPTRCPPAEITN